jgi:signal transduction histidine kinase
MIMRSPACVLRPAAWFRCLAGLLLLVLAHNIYADASVVLLRAGEQQSLRGFLDFMVDEPDISPEKLLAGDYVERFHRFDEPSMSFWDGKPIWLRFRIANNTSDPRIVLSANVVLFTQATLLYNRAQAGSPPDNVLLEGGLLDTTLKDDWPYRDVSFQLDVPTDQIRTVYLRLYTPYILLMNPYISDQKTYSLLQIQKASWAYLMIGIVCGVLLYLVMVALYVRGMREIYYCLAFACVSLLILLYGPGYLLALLPDNDWLKLHVYALIFLAQAFFFVGFSRQHFKTGQDFPYVERLLQTCQYLMGILLISSLVTPVEWGVVSVGIAASLLSVLLCVCSAYIWANSERRLTTYMFGTMIFLFVCILAMLENMGLIALGGKSRSAYEAGICLQTILFAFALAEKIRDFQMEKILSAVHSAGAQAETRAKSSFLAKMSHELRTPMNGLLGMLKLMEETPLNDQQQHYMHVMHNSGRMLLGVIDDVLDYSRIVAGKLRIEEKNFDLKELLNDIDVMFTQPAQMKSLRLNFAINADNPVKVHGDGVRLRQILVNLTSNAIKFTEKGAVTVRVWIEQRDTRTWLLHGEVEDTGIGISTQQITELFREYEAADGSKNYGSSGLGLIICKELVEMMGGKISVDSAPGYGSVFRFYINVHPPKSSSEITHANRQQALGSVARIMVVEDDPASNQVIFNLLTELGYAAEYVRNGAEAVKLFCSEDNHWDLVLMDIEMPVMDGVSASHAMRNWEIKNFRNATPIIAMTAHTMRSHTEKMLQAGMDDHLVKPIDPALLQHMLSRWLTSIIKS